MSEMECTSVQEDTTRNVRVKCAHIGNRSTSFAWTTSRPWSQWTCLPRYKVPGCVCGKGVERPTLRSSEHGAQTALQQLELRVTRWRAPLVDEDWYALCQGFSEGAEAGDSSETYVILSTVSTASTNERKRTGMILGRQPGSKGRKGGGSALL